MHEFKSYRYLKIAIKNKKYKLYIADTEKKKKIGLSKVKKLLPGFGMIFTYNKPTNRPFTMKNTSIPLRIIFLDASLKILEVYNCRPFQKKLIQPRNSYSYVIEIWGLYENQWTRNASTNR